MLPHVSRNTVLTLAACLLIPLGAPMGGARAHSGRSVSLSDVRVQGAQTRATLRLAEEDLIEVLALDVDRDGTISDEELGAGRSLVEAYVRNHFALIPLTAPPTAQAAGAEPAPCPTRLVDAGRDDDRRTPRLKFTFELGCGATTNRLALRCTLFQGGGFTHEHRATVRLAGTSHLQLFDARTTQAQLDVPVSKQILAYLVHGITHILSGYDHLIFLFALLLVGATLRGLIAVVTSFTVAHSVTLALGAFEVVVLPPLLVESAIALTIAYVGAENLVLRRFEWRWLLTFVLGLVHGFGFAGALAETGLPTQAFAMTLLVFNVGVELGQLGVVLLLFPLLRRAARAKAYPSVARALSLAIFLFGGVLFVMRAFFDA